MITNKIELQECINRECVSYGAYMFPTKKRRLMAWLKQEPAYLIMQWQILSRKTDYYKYKVDNNPSLMEKLKYLWYICKRNRSGCKLGLEIGTENIASGLLVYHYAGGCVINGGSIIGENCHLHGNNCIGNAGAHDLRCPRIGKNAVLGVGAKIIGAVSVGDNVTVAAGAVVVKDVPDNCVVAGVPATVVKYK